MILSTGRCWFLNEVKLKVLAVVSHWDPANLMAHAPDDEYEHEADQIFALAMTGLDPDVLGDGIKSVFQRAFGDNRFTKSRAECVNIAREILRIVADGL